MIPGSYTCEDYLKWAHIPSTMGSRENSEVDFFQKDIRDG